MQFSLKSMLLTTVVMSILCAMLFAVPPVVSIIFFLVTVLIAPPVLITGIVYGRGHLRAFCIGCVSSPLILVLLYAPVMLLGLFDASASDWAEYGTQMKIMASCLLGGLFASGAVSVFVRWLALRGQESPSKPGLGPEAHSVLHQRVTVVAEDRVASIENDRVSGTQEAS